LTKTVYICKEIELRNLFMNYVNCKNCSRLYVFSLPDGPATTYSRKPDVVAAAGNAAAATTVVGRNAAAATAAAPGPAAAANGAATTAAGC
jgi:hypothetical protein